METKSHTREATMLKLKTLIFTAALTVATLAPAAAASALGGSNHNETLLQDD